MPESHQYLATVPFDLYELHLLRLVAEHGSFTKAAVQAGLTQSAITRQVQGVESRLGIALFERTTRSVALTDAGRFLLREASRLTGDLDSILRQLRERFSEGPKEIRVGISQSISFSHLPGFFSAQGKRHPEVRLRITHQPSMTLLARLDANEIDVAVLCPPGRLPKSVRVTHRFADAFCLIIPPCVATPTGTPGRQPAKWRDWLRAQSWLLPHADTGTGARLRTWLRTRRWLAENLTDLDSFDLAINLVSLGQGVSMVPQRALAIYARRRRVQRFEVPERFTREIVTLTRRNPSPPAHVLAFVEGVLF